MKQYFGLPGIKEGDLLQRKMDNTLWLVVEVANDNLTSQTWALLMSSTTGNNRWVHREDWRNYDEAR